LTYCEKCGAEVKEGDLFCPSCGAPVKAEAGRRIRRDYRHAREEDLCFGGERGGDPLGLINFGLFLLVVGVVFTMNTEIVFQVTSWFSLMVEQQVPVRPPTTLINSGALFFGLLGLSNFLTAGIRVAFDKVWRRILPDALAGVGLLAFAYLISRYAAYSIPWTTVFAAEAIVFGALVILYTMLRNVF